VRLLGDTSAHYGQHVGHLKPFSSSQIAQLFPNFAISLELKRVVMGSVDLGKLRAETSVALRSAIEVKQLATGGERSFLQCRIHLYKCDQWRPHPERNNIMKRILRIAAVIAFATAFVFAVSAADDPKAPKGKGPKVVAGANAVMTCPHCKTDFSVKTTKPSKGTRSEKAIIANHRCEKCSTKLVTKGEGKAKTEVAEHTCKGCK
jgi:hypothetical protein